jgi:hypothetical protein
MRIMPPEVTDTFIVYGCSAGGVATYTWVDSIAEIIKPRNPKIKIKGLPDSGFTVNYPSMVTGKYEFEEKIKMVINLANQ